MHNKGNGNTWNDSISLGLWKQKNKQGIAAFISNTGSGCAVCSNISCPGVAGRERRMRDSSLVLGFFLVDSVI